MPRTTLIFLLRGADDIYMAYRNKSDPRQREAGLRHYRNNKAQYIARNTASAAKLREVMIRAKSRPCMDCGGTYRSVAMDFDHRDPSTKLMTPSSLPKTGSLRVLQEELAKCDVVCANCHRLREESRRAGRKARTGREEVEDPPTTRS